VKRQTPARSRHRPAYDPYLRAFHQAFALELEQIISDLPLSSQSRVLDLACGDGFYTRLLASRAGEIIAADLSPGYLERAQRRRGQVRFVQADASQLPFADGTFDLVWCAQSLITLPDPAAALREMARVTRRGGVIAVLETDEFHHVLLPWPVELELEVLTALHAASRQRYGSGVRLAPERRLRAALLHAGLRSVRKKTYAADRFAPFTAPARRFLEQQLSFVARMVHDRLSPVARRLFDRHVDPDSKQSFFRRPDAEMTCLNMLHTGVR
jgi:SAM-dependent methyltransferase